MFLVYTPLPSEKEAKELAKILLEKKLIACANIVKSSSLYKWEGKINDSQEWVLLCKTDKKITAEMEQLHPYDCPCVLTIPVDVNEKYGDWVSSMLK